MQYVADWARRTDSEVAVGKNAVVTREVESGIDDKWNGAGSQPRFPINVTSAGAKSAS